MERKETVRKLLDKVAAIIEHPGNKRRQDKWDTDGRESSKETVAITLSELPREGKTPCILFLGPTYWNKKIGLDIGRYYTDPGYYLENRLRMFIEHFENFEDDSFFKKSILIDYGVGFVPALFGSERVRYYPNKDPWVRRSRSLVQTIQDIKSLPFPDFFKNKHMRFVHTFYEQVEDLLRGHNDFKVRFPDWSGGLFSLALELRGWSRLLMDTIENKELVHGLMHRITEYRLKWSQQRTKYTGEGTNTMLGNDDINHPIVSPSMYEEFILPSDLEFHKANNRISYWHSCGNITPLASLIAKIPRIDLIQVSPFTDLQEMIKVFRNRETALQVWVHPVRDVLFATRKHMYKTLSTIAAMCNESTVRRYSIVSGHIQPMMDLKNQDDQIKLWLRVVKEVFEG